MTEPIAEGRVIIKNVSTQPYTVEELQGYVLEPGAEVDIMSVELPARYVDYQSAYRLVTDWPTAKLFQDIQAHTIQVVEKKRIKPAKEDQPSPPPM